MKLTKRELFALVALNGLLSDSEDMADERQPGETCPEATARLAVEHADALLEALKQ